MGRRIDENQKNKIIDLYWGQGLSIDQVAKIMGIGNTSVRRLLTKSGKGTRSIKDGIRKQRCTDNITDEQIIKMYNDGISCEKISEHFGKSEDFARQRLIRLGIHRRKCSDLNKKRTKLRDAQIFELKKNIKMV